jgi:hypothetical protein
MTKLGLKLKVLHICTQGDRFFGIGVWDLESQTEILWYRDVPTIRSSFNCRSRTGRLNWLHYVIKEGFYDRGDEKIFRLHDAIIHKMSARLQLMSIGMFQWPGNMLIYANIVNKAVPVTVWTVIYTLKNL